MVVGNDALDDVQRQFYHSLPACSARGRVRQALLGSSRISSRRARSAVGAFSDLLAALT